MNLRIQKMSNDKLENFKKEVEEYQSRVKRRKEQIMKNSIIDQPLERYNQLENSRNNLLVKNNSNKAQSHSLSTAKQKKSKDELY